MSRCTIQSLSDISSASPEHTKKTLQQCRPTHTQTETLVQTWKCTHAQIPGDKESERPAEGMSLPDICGGLTERTWEGSLRRESGQPGCNGADYLSIFPPMPAQHGVNNWNHQEFLKGSPALKMLYIQLCRWGKDWKLFWGSCYQVDAIFAHPPQKKVDHLIKTLSKGSATVGNSSTSITCIITAHTCIINNHDALKRRHAAEFIFSAFCWCHLDS